MPIQESDSLELLVRGNAWRGWHSASFRRSLGELASSFSLGLSSRSGSGDQDLDVLPGDSVEIRIAGKTVLAGYLDEVSESFSTSGHGLSVSGRSKTGQLVDCSATSDTGKWAAGTLLGDLAKDVCAPFGIDVKGEGAVKKLDGVVLLESGESVNELLSRACQMVGVVATTSPEGNLLLLDKSAAWKGCGTLDGRTILSIDHTRTLSERFSEYRSRWGVSTKQFGSSSRGKQTATATDSCVKIYRPLCLEDDGNGSSAKKRVEAEAIVRAAKSQTLSVSVAGWRAPNGNLWSEGCVVYFSSALVGFEGEFLIESAELTRDTSGSVTALSLIRPDALMPVPEVQPQPKVKKAGKKKELLVW